VTALTQHARTQPLGALVSRLWVAIGNECAAETGKALRRMANSDTTTITKIDSFTQRLCQPLANEGRGNPAVA
jgi:hypothetical protein